MPEEWVMFSLLLVCLFVCEQGYSKSCGPIFTKLGGHGPGTNRLGFGTDPDLGPGSIFPLFPI